MLRRTMTAALGVAALATAMPAAAAPKAQNPTLRLLEVFGEALAVTEREYVTPVDSRAMIEAALSGMMSSLDPHSAYISPKAWDEMTDTDPYVGIGLEMSQGEGEVVIQRPIAGGPAAQGGVRPGDVLLEVDHQPVRTLTEATEHLRGAEGSALVLSIRRGEARLEIPLTRAKVVSRGVEAQMRGDYGYLRISVMNNATAGEVSDAVAGLRRRNSGMKGLVLDLRDCPGGLLSASAEVADLFLDGGVIFTQRGRDPADSETYNARRGEALDGAPVAVLVNGETAAGAEILAGALQDNDRAVILGVRSSGAGSIQTVIPLNGGKDGALKVTTALVYRPSGKAIQDLGVSPDLPVGAPPEGYQGDYPLDRAMAALGAAP